MRSKMLSDSILLNGVEMSFENYAAYHALRVDWTLRKLREVKAKRILEVGAHPWVMTARTIDTPGFKICATVSAEEVTHWPDDIEVNIYPYCIQTESGNEARFNNYSANVERTIFDIQEKPDTVVACEVIEHLTRSPHVMLLNINHWLPLGGRLLITTPNGAQFSNPFRRKSLTPAYRSNIYERHQYIFTLHDLVDLVSLCGFKILEVGYEDLIERTGLSRIYRLLGKIPLQYFQDKFKKTIFLLL